MVSERVAVVCGRGSNSERSNCNGKGWKVIRKSISIAPILFSLQSCFTGCSSIQLIHLIVQIINKIRKQTVMAVLLGVGTSTKVHVHITCRLEDNS